MIALMNIVAAILFGSWIAVGIALGILILARLIHMVIAEFEYFE